MVNSATLNGHMNFHYDECLANYKNNPRYLITAWNEFVFVQILNPSQATTVPPFLYAIIGYGQIEWGRMAATSVVFLLPVVIFTFAVRNHLLRGVTFGAVRR